MSHDILLNAQKMHGAAMDSQHAQPRWGLVNGFDDQTGYVKVVIQPEGVQSGWIPVSYPCVGNGWGLVAPPPMDAQVKLIFENGHGDHPVLLGCTHTLEDAVPMVPAAIGGEAVTIKQGEIGMVGSDGCVVRLCLGNTLYMKATMLNIEADVTIKGDVSVTGSITSTGDQVAGTISQQNHKHGGVQRGGALTDGPQ